MSSEPVLEGCPATVLRISELMRDVGEVGAPIQLDAPITNPGTTETTATLPVAFLAPPLKRTRHRFAPLISLTLRGTLALVVLYGLLFNFSVVRGSSMSPSIFDGDRILIDHFSYLFSSVQRGDIIVLQYPLDPKLDYIKRVVGLPGDEILIEGGRVFVNGERLHEEYVDVPDLRSRLHTVVSENNFFVLGDNRCHSSDSREFGLVPAVNVLGKVDLRVWPLGRVGIIN